MSPYDDLHLRAQELPGPDAGERFNVANYEDSYAGVRRSHRALATSDNSVFAELGLKVGTKRVARIAERMGVSTQVSTNPAMTLGGLEEGVTPVEMADAYSTLANKGDASPGRSRPARTGRWRSRASRAAASTTRTNRSRTAPSPSRSARRPCR